MALVVIVTLPWQMLWASESDRVLLNGERAYILAETDVELVIYNAERNVTVQHNKADSNGLERLSTTGYVFEGPQAFDAELANCRPF